MRPARPQAIAVAEGAGAAPGPSRASLDAALNAAADR